VLLLEELNKIAEENKINVNHKSWTKEVKWLTRRLTDSFQPIRGFGIEVNITRITKNVKGKVNTSFIEIQKIPPTSPIPPTSQNHEGNRQENGDILGAGGIISPTNEIPPTQNTENHAQNIEIGDTGDIFSYVYGRRRRGEGGNNTIQGVEEENNNYNNNITKDTATALPYDAYDINRHPLNQKLTKIS
jgi:hypothetical protein